MPYDHKVRQHTNKNHQNLSNSKKFNKNFKNVRKSTKLVLKLVVLRPEELQKHQPAVMNKLYCNEKHAGHC